MMRDGEVYGLAVRLRDGLIRAGRFPWYSLTRSAWARAPFIRGFPVLLETIINGVGAINRSAAIYDNGASPGLRPREVFLTVVLAAAMAAAIFIIAPHLLSSLMLWLNLGGDVEGVSFHLWDGFYKCGIFILYIRLISFAPDIRRLFEYHGAEHKIIYAWERGGEVSAAASLSGSRLHPRCGTTFLLFVICVSIIAQAAVVPALLKLWSPPGEVAKHALTVFYKFCLIPPISAVAYELIRFADRLPDGVLATLLRLPGLALQRLTTREPDEAQLEVAVVALAEALGENGREGVTPPDYESILAEDDV